MTFFQDGVEGIILAGGEGKRLRPLSYYLQARALSIEYSSLEVMKSRLKMRNHNLVTITGKGVAVI